VLGFIGNPTISKRYRKESMQYEGLGILGEGISGDGGVGRDEDCDVFEGVPLLDGCAGTSKLLSIGKSKAIYILSYKED
jgi:hypothetical protein